MCNIEYSPDECTQVIQASDCHIKWHTSASFAVPQNQVINAGEPRQIISNPGRKLVYLCSNRIVGFHQELIQEWIMSVVEQILHMWLDVVGLVPEEIQFQAVGHGER